MILTGTQIREERSRGRLWIDPFYDDALQPNSYDFTLGNRIIYYRDKVLDCARDNPFEEVEIGSGGVVLSPNRIYLGHTEEIMGSDFYAPIIRGRSSIARLGLFIHVTADLIDIGSRNQWTVQLHAIQPLRIYPGMRIGQVTFWSVKGEIVLYSGKYQGSKGPQPSLAYREFKQEAHNPNVA